MIRYHVYLTPKISLNTYGDEIDISDLVNLDGVSQIKQSIDSGDYEVGVYTYDDITITANNRNGYFNTPDDVRSVFKYTRDLAKIRVKYYNNDGAQPYEDGFFIVFNGLINDEATRVDAEKEQIKFRVLSRDSVIRNTKVDAGVISNGDLISDAIYEILQNPKITPVLTLDADDVEVDNDIAIDDGTKFDNKSTREVLNSLLLASNSVMLLDADGVITIRSRANNETDVLFLYGPHDIKGRENIRRLFDYDSGLHRMFSAVKVNEIEVINDVFADEFGYRQKQLTLDFITDDTKSEAIAQALVNEFGHPKVELKIEVNTEIALEWNLLDRVSIDWPLRKTPTGNFLPICGAATLGSSVTPLPVLSGSVMIKPEMSFKIIEKIENPKEFTTVLKLRQVGTTQSDGWLME